MKKARKPEKEAPKGDPFVAVLQQGRERFNSLIAAARLFRSGFDEIWFRGHLETVLAPIIRAAAAVSSEHGYPVGDALFALSVRLWEQGVLGPATRFTIIPLGWNLLLPSAVPILVQDPRCVAAAVANALFQLSSEPEYRPEFWIESMTAGCARCSTVQEFLDLGRILAWRAGMAGLRETALSACEKLPPGVAMAALGMPETTATSSRLGEVLGRLRADPWALPGESIIREDAIKLVGRVGAFTGFQGRLIRPPHLLGMERDSGALILTDRDGIWRVLGDRYGAWWQRLREVPEMLIPAATSTGAVFGNFQVDRRGIVTWDGVKTEFSNLAQWSSCVADGTMAALTLPHSHAVHLLQHCRPGR